MNCKYYKFFLFITKAKNGISNRSWLQKSKMVCTKLRCGEEITRDEIWTIKLSQSQSKIKDPSALRINLLILHMLAGSCEPVFTF